MNRQPQGMNLASFQTALSRDIPSCQPGVYFYKEERNHYTVSSLYYSILNRDMCDIRDKYYFFLINFSNSFLILFSERFYLLYIPDFI